MCRTRGSRDTVCERARGGALLQLIKSRFAIQPSTGCYPRTGQANPPDPRGHTSKPCRHVVEKGAHDTIASHGTSHRGLATVARPQHTAAPHARLSGLASPADASISPQRGGHHWRPPISQLARSIHRTSHTLTLFIQGHRSLIRHRSLVSHTHTDYPPRAPAPRSRVASHSPVFPSQEKSKPFQRFKWYRTQRSVTMKATHRARRVSLSRILSCASRCRAAPFPCLAGSWFSWFRCQPRS